MLIPSPIDPLFNPELRSHVPDDFDDKTPLDPHDAQCDCSDCIERRRDDEAERLIDSERDNDI